MHRPDAAVGRVGPRAARAGWPCSRTSSTTPTSARSSAAAAALGVDAVLVTPRCADPLYRRSVRVSMGTVFQVPWTRVDRWPGGLEALQDNGFVVAALTLAADAVVLDELAADPPERLAAGARHRGRRAVADAPSRPPTCGSGSRWPGESTRSTSPRPPPSPSTRCGPDASRQTSWPRPSTTWAPGRSARAAPGSAELAAPHARADHDVRRGRDGRVDEDGPVLGQADGRDPAVLHAGPLDGQVHGEERRLADVEQPPDQPVDVGAGRGQDDARRDPLVAASATGDDDAVRRHLQRYAEPPRPGRRCRPALGSISATDTSRRAARRQGPWPPARPRRSGRLGDRDQLEGAGGSGHQE